MSPADNQAVLCKSSTNFNTPLPLFQLLMLGVYVSSPHTHHHTTHTGRSYRHAVWLPSAAIETKRPHLLRNFINRFNSGDIDNDWSDTHNINPQWYKVRHVLHISWAHSTPDVMYTCLASCHPPPHRACTCACATPPDSPFAAASCPAACAVCCCAPFPAPSCPRLTALCVSTGVARWSSTWSSGLDLSTASAHGTQRRRSAGTAQDR